ncbi:MAG: aminoacetone oxidase family FAD-binding enzyme [Clostridia bacterium]|nr:aminoacetone oxidase family FAD-binding enzyme [Clostridia bacterium]
MQTDCIILGGGAAGLAACAALAKAGMRVALIERLDRVGKKIMAAGNGRCNISNADMNPDYYREAAPFVRSVYEATPPGDVLSFFDSLGLMTAEEEGRIYPRTMMAASVLDVLRAGCEQENVAILTGQEVVSLTPSRRSGWCAQLASGEGVFAPVALCAMGGSASAHLGTDGSGTRLLEALGHSVSKLYPALVQLRCNHGALRSLKGIRVQAALTLEIDGFAQARESGELLFADYGVSGVCVFQLSGLAAQALDEKKSVRLLINLLPEIDHAHAWLHARIAALPQACAQSLFTGVFPRLLALALLKQAGIPAEAAAIRLNSKQRSALASAISAFPLPVTGTQGFKNAQVTRGGVVLDEVDPHTMASRIFDGLYLAGEVLDVDGPCGGYNLHFAFAGGLTAAKSITARLRA